MRLVALASTVALLATAVPAIAQNAVDTNTIVKMLTPGPNANGSLTRGIQHLGPAAANSTSATGAAAVSDKPSASLLVLFATGSAELTQAGRGQLDKLGAALRNKQLSQSHFRIEGHTDTTGDAQTNQALSERRAQAVVDYLNTQYGIDRGQLTPVGLGKQGLAVPTPDQTPEPRNRRVVVINLDG